MKKIFVLSLVLGFLLTLPMKAIAIDDPSVPVKFIYINGSNNNTEKDKKAFTDGMLKMHASMKKNFEADDFVEANLLGNGQRYIDPKGKVFFWGYNSKNSFLKVKDELLALKLISPKFAQSVRTMIMQVIHDAVWVQKEYNMQVIVNNLHKDIMTCYNNGEKVVLFGHSAGSFVTYRYLFHKMPALSSDDLVNLIEKKYGDNDMAFYKKHEVNPTCVDAMSASGLGGYSANGNFVVNPDKKKLRESYLRLNEYTNAQCTPQGEVLGVVNYGSPVALFYSDLSESNAEINKYNKDLYRYLKNNDMFLLTVNFTDDPIGFPLNRNVSASEIDNIYNIGFNQTGRGFLYSKSDVRSPASFVGAHNSYWKYPNKFSKAVVKAYDDGYKNFYPDL